MMRKRRLGVIVLLSFCGMAVLFRSSSVFVGQSFLNLTMDHGLGNRTCDRFCYHPFYAAALNRSTPDGNVVTLCTQGTPQFLRHVVKLCVSWEGPISLAVYCQRWQDLEDAKVAISTLRQSNRCIRSWLDWHLLYESSLTNSRFTNMGDNIWSEVTNQSETVPSLGSYPINAARNLARRLANSPYIFSIDIELFPSRNSERRLRSMLQSLPLENSNKRQVYVFPIFEVWSRFQCPRNKEELRNMFHRKQAISFHKYRCYNCHQIPNLGDWMNASSVPEGSTVRPLRIWRTVKRSKKFDLQMWEPFFVAARDLPLFDPRLSWEGKQNKMQLAYEMCLMDYDFHILDDAFLCHAPGVKLFNAAKERFRAKYMKENEALMKIIRRELTTKYGRRKDC